MSVQCSNDQILIHLPGHSDAAVADRIKAAILKNRKPGKGTVAIEITIPEGTVLINLGLRGIQPTTELIAAIETAIKPVEYKTSA